MVRGAVIGKRDMRATGERRAIKLNRRNPARHATRVLDDDLIARPVIAEHDLKAPPRARDTGIEMQHRAPQTDPQDPFDPSPIPPTC